MASGRPDSAALFQPGARRGRLGWVWLCEQVTEVGHGAGVASGGGPLP